MRVPCLLLAALSTFAPAAAAATISVPKDAATIQGALDAAAPGDTVKVAAGTYFERLVLSTPSVRLIGSKRTVVDAHPSRAGHGPAVRITAGDVRIESLTIRHARTSGPLLGDGVDAEAPGTVLRKVVVDDCEEYAVKVTGTDARVESCRVVNCRDGVSVVGARPRVIGTLFRQIQIDSIVLIGALARVEKNTFRAAGNPIYVDGQSGPAWIKGNDVDGFFGERAIHVREAPGAVVAKNEIEAGGADGVGVFVALCDGASVHANEVTDVYEDAIYVHDAAELTVTKNEVRGCGAGVVVDAGADDALVADNVIRDCATDGVRVAGDRAVVADNTVKSRARDGIHFADGDGGRATGNSCRKNGGEGLSNSSATNTLWQQNTLAKNRIDMAGGGAVTASGNAFQTGGPAQSPEVD